MKGRIRFFTEGIKYRISNKKAIRIWIGNAIINEKLNIGDINIVICDEKYLLKLNRSFLRKSSHTDIISFPRSEGKNVVSGDIYISHLRVKENAKKYGVSNFTELSRVIIHGILHLSGYRDESVKERTKMSQKEDDYLKVFPLIEYTL